MTRSRLLAPLALAAFCGGSLGTAAAAAQDLAGATLICAFTQECYDTLACTPTRHTVDVALPMEFPGGGSLLPPDGPVDADARMAGGSLVLGAVTEDGTAMTLMRSSEGFAKLSVLSGAPVEAMTYHGACRVAE